MNPDKFEWTPEDIKKFKRKTTQKKSTLEGAVRSLSLTVWRATRRAQTRRFKAAGIDSIVGDFDAAITDAVEGFLDGTYGRARGQRVFEGAIQNAWLPAAEAGFREGGGDPEDLTSDELAEIRDAEREQVEYARDWWAELGALRGVEGYDPGPRLALYVQSLRGWYAEWKLYGAQNIMLTWRYTPEKEHCATCESLNGQRHRAKWYTDKGYIPRQPGSETLECGGWNCGCYFETDEGEEYTL